MTVKSNHTNYATKLNSWTPPEVVEYLRVQTGQRSGRAAIDAILLWVSEQPGVLAQARDWLAVNGGRVRP